ncbi:putative transporter [Colletotrichum viniferum]|nr:putative transporter [Colletotrichum viniferum]
MASNGGLNDSGIGKDVVRCDEIERSSADKSEPNRQFSPEEIQGRFDLLRDLSNAEMGQLNKSVVKNVDCRMMPTITLNSSYLDRINVSNARLAGMQEDLHMPDTMWNLGISTFYIGYLIGQLPGNLWLAKSNPRWFLPSIMLLWGSATICTPALKNGASFAALRFLTGLCEAPFFPELHLWFFLIEGIATFVIGLSAFFLLPDWPQNTRFLTPAEREMAQYRILCSNGGQEETAGGTSDGLKDAARDPFTWIFCLMHFALVTAQSFKDFFPSIVKTFDFGELTTYLIQAPPYAFSFIFACVCAWSSGRNQESFWHVVLPIIGSAVGISVLISTINIGARYFGLFLLISGTYNGLNLQLSWETSVVPAPRSKKAALIAIANCISQTSHWFSPYFWPRSQEPFYRLGGGLVLVGCPLVITSAGLAKWRAIKLNKKLDEAEGYSEHSGVERGWRYVY